MIRGKWMKSVDATCSMFFSGMSLPVVRILRRCSKRGVDG